MSTSATDIAKGLLEDLDITKEEFAAQAATYPVELRREKPSPKAFSATEIVYHMIAVEELWQRRIENLLSGESHEFVAMDPDNEALEYDYNMKDYETGILLFRQRRFRTIELISVMTDEELRTKGIHSKYGEMDVLRILEIMVGHDRQHRAQLERTLSELREAND